MLTRIRFDKVCIATKLYIDHFSGFLYYYFILLNFNSTKK